MSVLLYILAYGAFIACAAIIVMKILGYLKKPVHLRWELYPVAHETHGRAEYGGSYMEDTGWWQQKQKSSTVGAIKGFLMEALFLHATHSHNKELWFRTYPFHIGLYLLIGSLGLTILCALMQLGGYAGAFFNLCFYLGFICNIAGFAGVLFGSLGLFQRRMSKPDLKKFSMPEHFFNLALFAAFSALGLLLVLAYGSASMSYSVAFFAGMFTFTPIPISALYALYLLLSCFIFVWVPFSFMGHAFMKYFTYHDIRWGDQPTQDSPAIQAKMAQTLGMPVSWKAPHIKGDGKKNWGEVATTNPAQDKE